jgi:hypothetical protein
MRDAGFEAEWFRQVTRQAGLSGLTEEFMAACSARLSKGAHEYGGDNSFADKAPSWLLRNAAEEGVDLPAWSVLFAQRARALALAGELDEEVAHLATAYALNAAANALRSWHSLNQAIDLFRS